MKLVGSIVAVIATVAAAAFLDDGTSSRAEVALTVFGVGTVIILVGLAARAVAARERDSPAGPSVADEIARLGRLHSDGVLTNDEFAEAKRRVLR